jgi:biotin carboxyl carrier protein
MSGETATESQTIEKTWNEIRDLVAELSRLAQTDVTPAQFYAEYLRRIVEAMAAMGGAVWARDGNGPVELLAQIGLEAAGVLESQATRTAHDRILLSAMAQGEALVVPPRGGIAADREAANPGDLLLVVSPLKMGEDAFGVVELFQRPGARPSAQRGYVQFVKQMSGLAGSFAMARQLRQLRSRQQVWQLLENFTRSVHGSLNPRKTAYTLANEGRTFVECDRLSVCLQNGGKSMPEAVSGQDLLDRRSSSVRLLGKLATTVVRAGEAVWYAGDNENLPPQIARAANDYVEAAHARCVAIVPLFAPQPTETRNQPKVVGGPPPRVLAVLVAEWYGKAEPGDGPRERMNAVAEHGALALANAIEHHSLFLLPVWQALGWLLGLFRVHKLPRTLAILGVVAGIVAALCLVPADFTVRGDGSLEPFVRRNVFAPANGIVADLKTEHGREVAEGDVVVVLKSDELKQKLSGIQGEIQLTEKRLQSLARRPKEELPPNERAQLAADEEEQQSALASLKEQRTEIETQIASLKVTSPITGTVTTWNLTDTLTARPVQRGDILLEVADLTSEWILEVHMPEHRMGHLLDAQRDLKPDLSATFILATDPGTTYDGKIDPEALALAAELDEQHGNSVLVTVRFDKSKFGARQREFLRPGAGVTVKVHCGKRAIGYVWFHDVYEFIQSRILFRL